MCLAIPGRIDSIYVEQGIRMGKVNFGGLIKEVCLAYLPEAIVGDYTIVHVGFAISRIDEASAQETLRTFASLGLLDEELQEMRADEAHGDHDPIANLHGEAKL
jgi:hydrogenase expression/formation protein HypC